MYTAFVAPVNTDFCKTYLNLVTFKTPFLLQIMIWTFDMWNSFSASPCTGVTNCLKIYFHPILYNGVFAVWPIACKRSIWPFSSSVSVTVIAVYQNTSLSSFFHHFIGTLLHVSVPKCCKIMKLKFFCSRYVTVSYDNTIWRQVPWNILSAPTTVA